MTGRMVLSVSCWGRNTLVVRRHSLCGTISRAQSSHLLDINTRSVPSTNWHRWAPWLALSSDARHRKAASGQAHDCACVHGLFPPLFHSPEPCQTSAHAGVKVEALTIAACVLDEQVVLEPCRTRSGRAEAGNHAQPSEPPYHR